MRAVVGVMNHQQLLRYSRQILLPRVDLEGQEKLLESSVLIIGAGGLGCPAAMYLAAAGVGKLVIVDDDDVELSNLQRQIGHTTGDIGRSKTSSLVETLQALNPDCHAGAVNARMDEQSLHSHIEAADLVLDCTDNYASRYAINRACVVTHTSLVSGAAIRFEGQLLVYDPNDPDSACYQCLYPDHGEEEQTCSENGVLSPVVGIIGSMQAVEAIKMLLSIGRSLSGRLLLMDAMDMSWREVRVPRDPSCPACSEVGQVS